MAAKLQVVALPGIPEVAAGDDLVALITAALDGAGEVLGDGDVVVVASKVVAKAEGRLVRAANREQAITEETVRVVASRAAGDRVTRIVQTRHGFVMAAAGVDASNVPEGTVLLLPVDPDDSARRIAAGLRAASGVRIGVIVADTFGRPWREGQTDLAVGAGYLRVVDDLRGSLDAGGRELEVSVEAVADEVAGAAALVMGKTSGCPVAVVRGLTIVTDKAGEGVRALIRPAEEDLFRLGSQQAWEEGYAAGMAERP